MAKNPHIYYNYSDGGEDENLTGLGRLSPYFYIGGNNAGYMTLSGYDSPPSLRHVRISAQELPTRNKSYGRYRDNPTIFDLDTKSLYFGHGSKTGSTTGSKILIGERNGGGAEGLTVGGLPVRLQQVHFRAFNPSGNSDEYSAFFLVSDPVGGMQASESSISGTGISGYLNWSGLTATGGFLKNDYHIHGGGNTGNITGFTDQTWSWATEPSGRYHSGTSVFSQRLVIGDPLSVSKHTGLFSSGCYEPLPYEIQSGMDSGTISGIDLYNYTGYKNNQTYDIEAPKHNTYLLSFDEDSLLVKQSFASNSTLGHSYQYPMDALISAKSIIDTGMCRPFPTGTGLVCSGTGVGGEVTGASNCSGYCSGSGTWPDRFDSVSLSFYDSSGVLRPSGHLLTKPTPKEKFDVITSWNGTGWDAGECPIFFGHKVTHIHYPGMADIFQPPELYKGEGIPIRVHGGEITFNNEDPYYISGIDLLCTGEYVTIRAYRSRETANQEKTVLNYFSTDFSTISGNILTSSELGTTDSPKYYPIAYIPDIAFATGVENHPNEGETHHLDYRIEHLNLGDIFIKDKAELSNFAFQCYKDGPYIRVRGGKVYYNNRVLTWADPDPRDLETEDPEDPSIIKFGGIDRTYIYIEVPYLFNPNAVGENAAILRATDKEPPLKKALGEGDFLQYVIAYVDENGGITQRQFGDIRDRNIPDVFNWPYMYSHEYKDGKIERVTDEDSVLTYDVFQRQHLNPNFPDLVTKNPPFRISTLRAQ